MIKSHHQQNSFIGHLAKRKSKFCNISLYFEPLINEVNQWLFGRGKQRLGGLSVEKTGAKKEAQKERLLRGAETRRRCRKADRA
jgi:hypothetical protein